MPAKTLFTPAIPARSIVHADRPQVKEQQQTSSGHPGSSRRHRLEFLDFLRFVAAFSVLIQHGCEKLFPGFVNFCTHYFQFGVFGVTLFFLCSGFVIPVSLEKAGSLKKFWKGRIFRLYPLYLVSITTTLALIATGIYGRPMPSLTDLLANLTMLQKFLGRPSVLHLYWTLCLEMAFYMMISAIFVMGLLKKTTQVTLVSLAITFLIGVIGTQVFHLFSSGWGTAFYFSTMFMGFLYFRFYKGQVSRPVFIAMFLAALALLLLVTWSNLYHKDQPAFLGTLSFLPVTLAILAAYLVFTASYILRDKQYPAALLHMGTISYSLYLVQGTVFAIVPAFQNPYLSLAVWLTAITAISLVTYRIIERPFIALGKR